jgi:DNA (cytosine-5)-methyltransferase 1
MRKKTKSKAKTKKIIPHVFDIFCGAGGMSLGFQNAGCKILGGIDNNPHAVRTHHKNFANCLTKAEPTDITALDLLELPIKPGEVDILIGGPPCQVFSLVGMAKMRSLGRNVETDPRNKLYKYLINFIDYYKPLFFAIENVNTLRNKAIFNQIVRDLEKGLPEHKTSYPGYEVYERILVASDYGVPQVRKRLFIVGVRQDLDLEFEFPKANTPHPISVGEAIGDLPELEAQVRPLKKRNFSLPKHIDLELPYSCPPKYDYQKKMRSKKQDGEGVWNHICRSHNEKDLEIFEMFPQGGRYKDLPAPLKRYGHDTFEDKYKRLEWDKPSWTLTAHMQKDCLAYIHPTQTRSISVREAARLQGFPDDFVFDAPMTRMFELVGNSVPPPLAEAIAKSIVKQVKSYHKNRDDSF